jgi:hypothetical protein
VNLDTCIAVAGIAVVMWNVVTVSLRQRIVPDHLLGRVNASYRLLAWGSQPLGALLGGLVGELVHEAAVGAIFQQPAHQIGEQVAVPAIEAWYLAGRDPEVTELAWTEGQQRGRLPYTRAQLKYRVYGTDRPNLYHETEIALREARRHAHDTRRLENDFPSFAALASDLKTWL